MVRVPAPIRTGLPGPGHGGGGRIDRCDLPALADNAQAGDAELIVSDARPAADGPAFQVWWLE
ncbi:hypothetical protein AB0K60_13005 [Thermopolyspora sp. NPDC052614]|uniref:hypothetical protein n=1 Tax=Thermopolyspora sp. NPDC052614 TaxID=3155682 RepID=UPI003415B201